VGEKDTAIVQGCDISNNVQRASVIFSEHSDFIRAVIRHRIHDESKAEDLFQDFFLSLVSRPIPPDVRNLKSYIYKALINDISDRIRHIERYQTLTHKYAEHNGETINKGVVEDAFIEKEQMEKMIELIGKRTTKREIKAIAFRYCDNLGVQEVAERMGIDSRSVSRYISTGLRKVRRFFKFEKEDLE
jgi:RNA polymerase sigma factor (sigma-70 family)